MTSNIVSHWQSKDFRDGVIFAEMRMLDFLEQAKEKALVVDVPKNLDEDERTNLALASAFEHVYDLLSSRFESRREEIMDDAFLKMTAEVFKLLESES